jgi:hypothetical protein
MRRSHSLLRHQAHFLEGRVKLLETVEESTAKRIERARSEAERITHIRAARLRDLDWLKSRNQELEQQKTVAKEQLSLQRKLSSQRIRASIQRLTDIRRSQASELKSRLSSMKSMRETHSTPQKTKVQPFRFSRSPHKSRLDLSTELSKVATDVTEMKEKVQALSLRKAELERSMRGRD